MRKLTVIASLAGGALLLSLTAFLPQKVDTPKISGPAVARQTVLITQSTWLERYGIKKNDLLLEVNGVEATEETFREIPKYLKAGYHVHLLVYRITDTGAKAIRLTLGKDQLGPLLESEEEDYDGCEGDSGFGCENNLCKSASNSRCLITATGNCADCAEADEE